MTADVTHLDCCADGGIKKRGTKEDTDRTNLKDKIETEITEKDT